MNRFDDRFSWQLLEKLVAPIISVCLAYVAFRVQYEHRMTAVEVKSDSTDRRLESIEKKIDRLLERKR